MSAAAATAVCACARGVCVHVREEGKQCGEIVGVLRDDVVGAKQGDEVGASVAAAGPEPHVSAAERERRRLVLDLSALERDRDEGSWWT